MSKLQEMGDLQRARSYLEQALQIRQKAPGKEHAKTAQSLSNLGYLLLLMGDLSAARAYFERALAINRKAFTLTLQANTIDDRRIGQTFSSGSDKQRLLFLRTLE